MFPARRKQEQDFRSPPFFQVMPLANRLKVGGIYWRSIRYPARSHPGEVTARDSRRPFWPVAINLLEFPPDLIKKLDRSFKIMRSDSPYIGFKKFHESFYLCF